MAEQETCPTCGRVNCLRWINEQHGHTLDWSSLPHEQECQLAAANATIEALRKGRVRVHALHQPDDVIYEGPLSGLLAEHARVVFQEVRLRKELAEERRLHAQTARVFAETESRAEKAEQKLAAAREVLVELHEFWCFCQGPSADTWRAIGAKLRQSSKEASGTPPAPQPTYDDRSEKRAALLAGVRRQPEATDSEKMCHEAIRLLNDLRGLFWYEVTAREYRVSEIGLNLKEPTLRTRFIHAVAVDAAIESTQPEEPKPATDEFGEPGASGKKVERQPEEPMQLCEPRRRASWYDTEKFFCGRCGAGIGFWTGPDESPCRCPTSIPTKHGKGDTVTLTIADGWKTRACKELALVESLKRMPGSYPSGATSLEIRLADLLAEVFASQGKVTP